jgi:ribonuclease HII
LIFEIKPTGSTLPLKYRAEASDKLLTKIHQQPRIALNSRSFDMELLAGVDEVGRGSFAGPVVACAIILPIDYTNPDIKDSKKITSIKKREKLSAEIYENAIAIGLGVVCSTLIDRIGIVPATKQAMHMAIARLSAPPDRIIIDAVALNNLPCPSESPQKAEDQYQCVAAASIVGKVYRDRLMDRLHETYPTYGWNSNKGYGSAAHIAAIKSIGVSPLHRMSFLGNYV